MSNEDLVSRIQEGERALLPELWAQVERFVSVQAGRRARLLRGVVEQDDLYNTGYLAMVAAVDTYSPKRDMQFIGWLSLHLKTAFAEATGYRSARQQRDPLHRAGSLNVPLGEDTGGGTLEDIIADPESATGYEDVEDRLWRAQLRAELDKALEELPEEQRETLRQRYFRGQTFADIARDRGLSTETVRQTESKGLRALRHPRVTRELRQFIEERTPYFMHVGVSSFTATSTSAVEALVLRREELAGSFRKLQV